MSGIETRAVVGLSLALASRMLDIFTTLPVLATYGQDLTSAAPAPIGLVIGAYGLTQATLQIPFEVTPDRIDRHPVIVVGLLISVVGTALVTNIDPIWGVIAGHILQNAGAIPAVMMILFSDPAREQYRARATAMIDMSIGAFFTMTTVLDPVLVHLFGLYGLFWFTARVTLAGLLLILFFVPQPDHMTQHHGFSVVCQTPLLTLKHGDLPHLDAGILTLHATLMVGLVALSLALVHEGGLLKEQHWWVHLTALLVGLFGMVLFIIRVGKKRHTKRVLAGVVVTLLACELFFLVFGHSPAMLVVGAIVFFTTFNLLEASLPSLVSKVSPVGDKGTAMGVYSISQFLNAAPGGTLGGWMFQHGGLSAMFIRCAVLTTLWLVITVTMCESPCATNIRLPLAPIALQDAALIQRFRVLPGMADVMVVVGEAIVYIKVDTQQVDRTAPERLAQAAPDEC